MASNIKKCEKKVKICWFFGVEMWFLDQNTLFLGIFFFIPKYMEQQLMRSFYSKTLSDYIGLKKSFSITHIFAEK